MSGSIRIAVVSAVVAIGVVAAGRGGALLSVAARDAGRGTTGQAPDPGAAAVAFEDVAGGFVRPVGIANAGDGSGRLFVIEKVGRIRIVRDGALEEAPFLDIASRVESASNERGLLGLAFDPDYATNGAFYVNYTTRGGGGRSAGATVVARYRVTDDPDVADPRSEHVVLTFAQPFPNHNGGHLAFGPDGYLYIGTGDGGAGDDPEDNAQDLGSLLGKMLRIDVAPEGDGTYEVPDDNPFLDVPGARPEIWAFGLRNPWRYAFDRATGDLYIGDVGQNAWEEIDFQAADSPGGENYGWKIMEGTHCRNPRPNCTPPEGHVEPIFEHDRDDAKSITGGDVYRGAAFPSLQGLYVYADYVTGLVWGAARDDAGDWRNALIGEAGFLLSSFGVDEAGELYAVSDSPGSDAPNGRLYRVVAEGAEPTEPFPATTTPPPPTSTGTPTPFDDTPGPPSATPTEIGPEDTPAAPSATPTRTDDPGPPACIYLPVGHAGP